jgi:hypothetical protein
LFERFGVLTSKTIKDKDLRELLYVNVADKLHYIVAARALWKCGLGLLVYHDGVFWLGQ